MYIVGQKWKLLMIVISRIPCLERLHWCKERLTRTQGTRQSVQSVDKKCSFKADKLVYATIFD